MAGAPAGLALDGTPRRPHFRFRGGNRRSLPAPGASLRRANKGTLVSPNVVSRPGVAVTGRSHARLRLHRTHRSPVPALSYRPLAEAATRGSREASRQPPEGGLSCTPGQSGAGLRRPGAAAALEWPAAAVGPRVWVWHWTCGQALPSLGRGVRGWSPALREVAAEVVSLSALRVRAEDMRALQSTASSSPEFKRLLVQEKTTKACYSVMRPPGVRGVRKPLAPRLPAPNVTPLTGSPGSLNSASCFCYRGHLNVTLFSLTLTLYKVCLDLSKLLICT